MRAHTLVLCGTLLLAGLLASGCPATPTAPASEGPPRHSETDGGVRPDVGDDAGHDAGTPPLPSDAGADAGRASDFGCDPGRQQGCEAGASCLYAALADGGTGSRCFEGACDTVAQDCPEGQRCTYVLEDGGRGRRCVEEGTSGEGEPCSLAHVSSARTFDSCRKGLYCADSPRPDGGTAFVCQRLCHEDGQCQAPQQCNEVLRLTGTEELPRVCGAPSARCQLPAQDCASPLGCYPSRTRGTAVCAPTGGLVDGAPCEYSNQCARGSGCVGAPGVCRALCRHPTGEPGCPADTLCQPLPDFPGVGACVP